MHGTRVGRWGSTSGDEDQPPQPLLPLHGCAAVLQDRQPHNPRPGAKRERAPPTWPDRAAMGSRLRLSFSRLLRPPVFFFLKVMLGGLRFRRMPTWRTEVEGVTDWE